MSKTTDLPFDGGAIVVPSGETTSAQVHTVFLRKITITDAGHESQIYAMFDMNKPKTTAPFFEPVSAFNLAEWCVRGDVVQVDLSEAMSQGTDRYAGVLQDVVLSNDAESGIYVSACTLRTTTTYDSDTIRLSWFSLYLIMDQETSVSYLATPEYGSPTMMDVPDHKVKIGEGYSQESPNYLAYKIMGDNSTVRVDIVSQNGLGQPIDPFLRISTIGSSGDGKVLADYIDDNRDYLVNKLSGSGGIAAQVKVIDGYRYVEIAPDPEAQDPLARMSDLEATRKVWRLAIFSNDNHVRDLDNPDINDSTGYSKLKWSDLSSSENRNNDVILLNKSTNKYSSPKVALFRSVTTYDTLIGYANAPTIVGSAYRGVCVCCAVLMQDGQNVELYGDAIDYIGPLYKSYGGSTTSSMNVHNHAVYNLTNNLSDFTINIVTINSEDSADFLAEITNNIQCTVTVTINGTAAKYSSALGNTMSANKFYRLRCEGSCWTLEEFI